MKKCSRCKLEKEEFEFSILKSKKDGLDCYCKFCRKEYYKSKNYNRQDYNKNYKRKDCNERKEYLKNYHKKHKYPKSFRDKEMDRIRKMVKRALVYTKEEKIKSSKELLGWTKHEFLLKLGSIPENVHIDHRIPISWFKKTTPISIINHLDNLQYLKIDCNLKKSNQYNDKVSKEYMNLCKEYIEDKYLPQLQY